MLQGVNNRRIDLRARIPAHTNPRIVFVNCLQQSPHIPRAVAILGESWLRHAHVHTVTFEAPSHLAARNQPLDRVLAPGAFLDFSQPGRGLIVDEDFLVDPNDSRASRYIRKDGSVFIAKGVRILGKSCFSLRPDLGTMTFEPGSGLKRIEESCFRCCCLSLICIPWSVMSLGMSCLAGAKIEAIAFEAPSRLQTIQEKCFQFCSMKSVCIPRTVPVLPQACFDHARIEMLVFHSESILERIEARCLANCSLNSVCFPPSLTSPGELCFDAAHIENMISQAESRLATIDESCFVLCFVKAMRLPDHIGFVHASALLGASIQSITVHGGQLHVARSILSWIWDCSEP
jgi:hypothetical protein